MSYQPRSTNPYIMEKKLNDCVGGGGLDPSVLEEIQTEISILGSENTVMAQDIIDIKGSLNSINDNLTASNQTAGVSNVPFRFGCTDDGKFGYIINQGGADSVIPFKNCSAIFDFPSCSESGGSYYEFNFIDLDNITVNHVNTYYQSSLNTDIINNDYIILHHGSSYHTWTLTLKKPCKMIYSDGTVQEYTTEVTITLNNMFNLAYSIVFI